MRKNILFILIAFLCVLTMGLVSCKKEKKTEWIAERNFTTGGFAYVRIIHAAPNFTTQTNARDSFNISFAGAKVNAGSITYTTVFPTASYLALPSGEQTIRFFTAGTDDTTVYTFTKNLQQGQYYSFVITDSLKNSRDESQMWIADNFSKPDTSSFSIRFINAVTSDTAGRSVDLYSVKQQKNLFSNVQRGSFTNFTANQVLAGNDTLILRRSGTLNELARLNAIALSRQRVYTVIYRGLTTLATGSTKRRELILYNNL
ncbi:MAG: DUF4397 domain-containing protein [Flavisolibacter sp.]|nr:DUF4397 domain-containing protein [Flavisolibacter sp.]